MVYDAMLAKLTSPISRFANASFQIRLMGGFLLTQSLTGYFDLSICIELSPVEYQFYCFGRAREFFLQIKSHIVVLLTVEVDEIRHSLLLIIGCFLPTLCRLI